MPHLAPLPAAHAQVISKEQGRKLSLTSEAERQLLAYAFPDNISVSV
jgi:transcriptional regulator with GAF, ATPase, and Fis domain